jgi:alanine dehydrogenase
MAVRVLSAAAVDRLLDLERLLPVVADALRAQRDGRVERPDRPHFPVGPSERVTGGTDGHGSDTDGRADTEPAGTALVMPAYVHGAEHYVTKLASVHEGNADRGLDTVQAQIAVTEADTGRPAAYLAGTRVTNARTGCVGGLCVARLPAPVDLAVVGAGRQARWQARAVAAATELAGVAVYAPSDSRERCVADLRERGIDARAVDAPRAAVTGADAVVTATTATTPVFPGAALEPGALVVAVGAYTPETRELDARTVERSRGRRFADVPAEAATVGDFDGTDVDAAALRPVADLFDGTGWPPAVDGPAADAGDVTLVKSVGSATLDAAAATHLLAVAERRGAGRTVRL